MSHFWSETACTSPTRQDIDILLPWRIFLILQITLLFCNHCHCRYYQAWWIFIFFTSVRAHASYRSHRLLNSRYIILVLVSDLFLRSCTTLLRDTLHQATPQSLYIIMYISLIDARTEKKTTWSFWCYSTHLAFWCSCDTFRGVGNDKRVIPKIGKSSHSLMFYTESAVYLLINKLTLRVGSLWNTPYSLAHKDAMI